jgi:hypothetical protein
VNLDDAIGSLGVALLLLAFFLNLTGRLAHGARAYQAMNAVGAGLACYASYRIGFAPFVVLEGTWTLVALVALASGVSAGYRPPARTARSLRARLWRR